MLPKIIYLAEKLDIRLLSCKTIFFSSSQVQCALSYTVALISFIFLETIVGFVPKNNLRISTLRVLFKSFSPALSTKLNPRLHTPHINDQLTSVDRIFWVVCFGLLTQVFLTSAAPCTNLLIVTNCTSDTQLKRWAGRKNMPSGGTLPSKQLTDVYLRRWYA